MRKKGFALAMVIMIILIIMIMLFGAMATAHNSVFVVGNFNFRVASLYAAEAGVSRGIYQLEGNPAFQGVIKEKLRSTSGRFVVRVDNPTAGSGDIRIISTGFVGPFRRQLQAIVRRGSGSYNAMTNEGPIFLSNDVFINGIETLHNPKKDAGHIHTNYSGSVAIEADPLTEIFISGMATARGGITDKIPDLHKEENSEKIEVSELDKAKLLSGGFPLKSIQPNGIVIQNTEINGNLEVTGQLILRNDAVLHVKGDLKLNHGVTGRGSVVVEGQCIIKGTANLEATNMAGIVVFSEGDLYLCSDNSTETPSGGMDYTGSSNVAKFFARMPSLAPNWISHDLPDGAPRGIGFFRWYANNRSSSNTDFLKWRDGDPTNPILNPGLPQNVKIWLDLCPPIVDDLEQWYELNK